MKRRGRMDNAKGEKYLVWQVIRQAFKDIGDKTLAIRTPAILWIVSKRASNFFDLADWDQRWVIEGSAKPSWLECARKAVESGRGLTRNEERFLREAIKEISGG